MRDIDSLTKSKMEKAWAWAVNNCVAREPKSMQEASQKVVHMSSIYEKTVLQSDVSSCAHLSLQDQNNLLEFLTEMEH